MSFLSASVPRKVSDNQFIGDLMNLFERRKIKCGDPASLENFASTLGENDALRSQLFTLCTAISHMASEDLSGEQLLALVARALGGPGLPKRAGAVEIPDSMRTAFLTGYDAWINRGNEPKEPLPWPQPGPAQSDAAEPVPAPPSASAEPAAARPSTPGVHTVQEAIDIAKERSLAAAPPLAASSLANLEGLTISELKSLLEDIEHRVQRIQPQLHDLTAAGRSQPDGFHLREKIREIEAAPSSPASAETAGPAASSAHRGPRPARIDEAAFLARHAYLRPTRHIAAVAADAAKPANSAPPSPAAAVPAAPPPLAEPVAPAAAPATQAVVIPVPQPVAAVAPPIEILPPPVTVHPDPIPYTPRAQPVDFPQAESKVNSRVAAAILAGCTAFLLVLSGLAGIFIYPSFHPKTIDDYPELKNSIAASSTPSPAPVSSGYVASGPQLIVSPQIDPSAAPYTPPAAPHAAAPRPRTASQPSQPVAVWPYVPQPAPRDTAPAPYSPNPAPAARRSADPDGPVSVPSATIIAYAVSAPQPVYPADEPKGINGTVVVQVTISREGKVTGIRAVSGPEELRPATVQAVEAWRFRPYLINGTPADVTTTLGFLFRGQ